MIGVDLQERDEYIVALESRFLFLAADARSTLRGWKPSDRNVLLEVRKRLNIPCSSKLSTEDLEVKIFLHLLQDNSSEESETSVDLLDLGTASNIQGGQLSQWKAQVLAGVKVGAGEFQSMILKGGGIFTFTKIYQLGFLGAASRYVGIRSMMTLLGPALGNLSCRSCHSNAWNRLCKNLASNLCSAADASYPNI